MGGNDSVRCGNLALTHTQGEMLGKHNAQLSVKTQHGSRRLFVCLQQQFHLRRGNESFSAVVGQAQGSPQFLRDCKRWLLHQSMKHPGDHVGADLNHFLESTKAAMERRLGNGLGPTQARRRAVTDDDSRAEGLPLHLYARPSRTRDDYE